MPDQGAAGSVLGKLMSRSRAWDSRLPASDPRFPRAILFGSILYRVAFADGKVDDVELDRIQDLLTSDSGFDEDEALCVVRTIRERPAEDLERQHLCADLNRVAEMETRIKLLECLFRVAAVDGQMEESELREIRLIANYLWIDARDFHSIRAKAQARGGRRGS